MTPRLRLLLSSHGASPYGAERVLLTLAEGFAARGHDVTLEIPHEGPALDAARRLKGVRVWHSRRPRLPRNAIELVKYLAGAPLAASRLWREIRRGGYDLVWVNSMFNPLAAVAARLAGTPVVWHLHERNLRGPAAVPMAWAVRFCSDVVVAVSEFVAATFQRIPGAKGRMRVLFAPFRRLPAQPLRERSGPFVVGYVGQFEPRKRVEDVVQAIARLPGVRGVLVGDGKKRARIEALVRQLGLEDRVDLVGFQDDVVEWYRRMDCMVIASRDEPCPLVAFESMAVGRPVIASAHGGHPEVLGDAALFFPLGDVAALADRIARLERDPQLAARLREAGLRRSASFVAEQWWDRVLAIAAEARSCRRAHPRARPAAARVDAREA